LVGIFLIEFYLGTEAASICPVSCALFPALSSGSLLFTQRHPMNPDTMSFFYRPVLVVSLTNFTPKRLMQCFNH
jgi:hypothetical protein